MEVVLSQFTKSLTKSGLMTSDEVEAFIESLPPDKRPTDGRTLAQELVRHKKLTKFQAQAVYQGKTKGLTLGDYVVLDRIGQGGMGQVFKAKHKVMDRVVALKTLPAAATNSGLAVQRFHREVKVAARLSHPNIVTAHDAGESHGLHYLVMECVEGDDLGAVVRQRGRLPANRAIDYIIQAAKGLEYAHKQKVIHRDIKPSNLLLDKDGSVKVLDMGLARLNEAIGPEDQTAQETLTGTGQVMGTIDFMPPEQAENTKKADERSDIYSLGCTLYYILTGQAIYSGDTVVMKILAHRETDIPSLRTELPEVSEQLDAIYQKMVAKKPDDRYGSMTEVIAELEKCSAPSEDITETATFEGFSLKGTAASDQTLNLDMPVISPVDQVRKARPKKASKVKLEKNHIIYGSVALGVVLVLLLLGVVFSMRTPEGTLVIEVNQPDAEILVDDGKITLKSPSDNEPVEIEVEEGKHTLSITKGGFRTFAREFEIASGGEEVIRVTLVPLEKKVAAKAGMKAVSQPDTPDETSQHKYADGRVNLLHTLEGHTGTVCRIVFTPDGTQLVSGSGGEDDTVRLWDTRTGKCIDTIIEWHDSVWALDISPDGRELLVGGKGNPPEIWDFEARRLKASLLSGTCYFGRFSPNGQYLAVGFDRKVSLLRSPDWESIDTLEVQSQSSEGYLRKVMFSSDSARVAYCATISIDEAGTKRSKVAIWNIDTSRYELEETTSDYADMECIALSPDATTIAWGRDQRTEVLDVSKGQTVEVLEHRGQMRCLAYSPDGAFLLGGQSEGLVYVWHLADRKLVAEIPAHTEQIPEIRFSQDGRLLATCSEDKTIKIWDVSAPTHPEGTGVSISSTSPPLANANDPDRRAAEWVLKRGGKVYVCLEGEQPRWGRNKYGLVAPENWIVSANHLPSEVFFLSGVYLMHATPDDIEHLSSCARLEHLDLPEPQGYTLHEIHMIENLKYLDATNSKVDDEALASLAECSQLRQLGIAHTEVTNEGLARLAELKNIETLVLWNTPISDQGLAHLAGMTNLRGLWLGATKTSPKGLSHLAGCKKLEFLALTSISPDLQPEYIANVRFLDLTGAQVTDDDLQCLHDLRHLEFLDISGSGDGITSEAVAELQEALPNCEIIREFDVLWGDVPTSNPADPFPIAFAPFTAEKAKWYQQRWADHLGVPVEFTNSIGMKMVLIPPGEFMMGATEEQAADMLKAAEKNGPDWAPSTITNALPQHKVRITRPFYLAIHELTRGQFRAFVNATNYKTKAELNGIEEIPIRNVTWGNSVAFCKWLSNEEAQTYTLPTEAQWEFACRAGSTTLWHFGDDQSKLEDYGWLKPWSEEKPQLVGQKLPNSFGLFDMYGNVEEWCLDWYSRDYYRSSAINDPTGPEHGNGNSADGRPLGVVRGWQFKQSGSGPFASWGRGATPSDEPADCRGFRPVMLIDPKNPSKSTPKPPAESAKPEPTSTSETKRELEVGRTPVAVAMQADDWIGLRQLWRMTGQEITGSTEPSGIDFNTFLCSKKSYRNFELNCCVRLINGNTGIQFRSEYVDKDKFILRGPQVDIVPGFWGSLYGEKAGGMMEKASGELVRRIVKANQFNDVYVRCVGKHVTIKINNETTVDETFPTISDEGVIGLQLHSDGAQAVFRNIQLTELSDTKP